MHRFRQCWSDEYLCQLQEFVKWNTPSPYLQVGDIICPRGEPTMSTKWPLAHVTNVHPGMDERVRVVTVQTSKGTYNRPITKIVPLI